MTTFDNLLKIGMLGIVEVREAVLFLSCLFFFTSRECVPLCPCRNICVAATNEV